MNVGEVGFNDNRQSRELKPNEHIQAFLKYINTAGRHSLASIPSNKRMHFIKLGFHFPEELITNIKQQTIPKIIQIYFGFVIDG